MKTLAIPKNCLINRVVRDLAWTLYGPPLFVQIDHWPKEWFKRDYIDEGVWPWLCQLDHDPTLLNQRISQQNSTRLGIYFETLLSFYFTQYPRFELIAQNYQVNGHHQTLGEFDFIVYDHHQDCAIHIESAVKFYLGHKNYQHIIPKNQPLYNWHQWLGPNQKDTLAIKMRHLKEHQLLLGKTVLGTQALNDLNISHEKLECRLLINGRFYLPQFDRIEPPSFSNINLNNTSANDNHWIDSHRFLQTKITNSINTRYCLLPRRYWLSELTAHDIPAFNLYTIEQVKDLIKQDMESNVNAWQLAEMSLKNKILSENKRFFIILNKPVES